MLRVLKVAGFVLLGLFSGWNGQPRFQIFAQESSQESTSRTSEVVEAGLIDLSFQRDMQDSMKQLISGIRSEQVNTDASLINEEFVEEIPDTAAGNLLAQNQPENEQESTAQYEVSTSVDPANASEEEFITLNFQAADVNALINLVSQVTGKSFIVDPRVKGKITLVSGSGLPTDQLYDIFLSVLEVSNFATVESGSVTKILPKNLIKQHPTPTATAGSPETSDAHFTHLITLEHASVAELLPILRPLLPPTAHIAPHTGSNTLILTGTGANINRTLDLVRKLDKEQRGVDIQVIYLKYADATKLAPIITQTVSAFASESALQGQAPSNLSVQIDEGLNALIIQAPKQEFPVIQALIDQLDIDRPESSDVHVVYLKFAQATDLVTLLTGLQQPGQQDESGAIPREEVSIQADEQTNALIIRAEQKDFESILSVIEELDIRREQVFIETIIAEVSFNKESELGVDWSANKRTSDGGDLSASTDFSDSSGFQVGFLESLFTNLVGDIVPSLNIVLTALRSDSNTNIISTPNLLTLDNEEAEIIVAQEVPFVTGSFTTNATTTSSSVITDGDGNTATSTGVVNPFQTIERKDVGLTLRVTPQINEGGTIRLEIEQELSNVAPQSVQGASDLITNKRTINATVQVDDDQIIVLGGLIRDDSVDTFEWIPVLGKIPLIGALFRKKKKSAVKTNLMIFLQPKIIRNPEDLNTLTSDRYELIRSEQTESQPETRNLLPEPPPRLLGQPWQKPVGDGR